MHNRTTKDITHRKVIIRDITKAITKEATITTATVKGIITPKATINLITKGHILTLTIHNLTTGTIEVFLLLSLGNTTLLLRPIRLVV